MSDAAPPSTPASATSSSSTPSGAIKWAIVAAVPALAFVVGIVAMPRPQPVSAEKDSVDRAALGAAVSRQPQNPKTKVNAVLGDAIRVHGADLPAAALSRGARFAARFHFEALAELDQDWQIFLHIDGKGFGYRIHGDHYPVNGKYNTTVWQKGDQIVDDWSTVVPRDAPAGVYDVWLGFYVGEDRLEWTDGDDSAHDGTDRVRVGTIVVQ